MPDVDLEDGLTFLGLDADHLRPSRFIKGKPLWGYVEDEIMLRAIGGRTTKVQHLSGNC